MAGLKLSFLGPPHIDLNNERVNLDARKNVALLVYLGVTAESQTRDTLITLLWPELETSRARAVLRRNLSMLKKSIGGQWLHVDRDSIGLEQRPDLWLDTEQFQLLKISWQDHGHPETQLCHVCLDDLLKAVTLYRGDFLTGFSLRDSASFDEWQLFQTEALRREFGVILERLILGYCAQGKFKDALPHALRWISIDPLHEPAHRQLMHVYTWSGQRSAALRQYSECERVLGDELGVKPAEETTQLYQQIKARRQLSPPTDSFKSSIDHQKAVLQAKYEDKDVHHPKSRIEQVRLIGRKDELQATSDLWWQTLKGQGQTLLISGEAGIGKTRLVRELILEAERSGGRALTGGCFMEGGTPYAPFRQIIREVLRSRLFSDAQTDISLPDFVVRDLLILTPELQSQFADLSTSPAATVAKSSKEGNSISGMMDPPAEQQRLFDNLGIFFRTLSDLTPLLLILEDVQWADSGTLQLMQYLARHTRQTRIMIVTTFRDVSAEEAPFLHKILLDLNREQIGSYLNLPRLGRTETGELLYAIFSVEITPEFLDGIYNETEGNPFYIEEVCKALVESGKVYYQDGSWHRPSMEELGIPKNVRVAIQLRVSVLPQKSQEILKMAAILGREFDLDTLIITDGELISGTQAEYEETLIETLENAERAQLIEKMSADRGGTYTFVHTLIASTLVESLRTLPCRQLHRRAANAIEKQYPDDYEALAYHYIQAGEAKKALNYLLLAGDRARVLHAHQEAIDSYNKALNILKEAGDLERAARTYMKLGLTYNNAFDFIAARQAYEDGFVLWQQACADEPLIPPPPAPHALRIAAFKPESLDFRIVLDTPSVLMAYHLFCGLVEIGPEMDVVPGVAHSWEVLENGCKYIFHLRDDVRWSDGVPVTAHDFEYSWKKLLDPSRGLSTAVYLFDVKNAREFFHGEIIDSDLVGVNAIDKYTLDVELERPTSYFLYSLTVIDTFPFPKHALESYGDNWADLDNIVTNGPFNLAEWKQDEFVVLERNPDYHGHFPGNVQRVEYIFNTGRASIDLYRYEENKLDMCCDLSPGAMILARQKYAGEYVTGPWLSTDFIGFDVSRPPFNDLRVRQAFALATDKRLLADVAMRGFAFPATGGMVPPGMPGHSHGIGLPYDPESAKSLLASAGYPGGHGFPEIVCLARDDPGHDLICEYLQTQWREILGIEPAWEFTEWGNFHEKYHQKKAHMLMVGWVADYPDPDNFLRVQWWLDPAWRHEQYWSLVENARRVMDQEKRIRMYQQADRILADEVPLFPLTYERFHMLVKPWVKRLPTSPLVNFFWKDIILEEH
jgi:ABC-type oligopeptide transport system substrate-binding subunit/DNA-binding SARP family transcriptional activator